MRYYKKLKTEKVVNLMSEYAIKTQNSSGRNLTFEFDLPYSFSGLSKNAEMSVIAVSYQNVNAADDNNIFVFRCREVNGDDIYDSQTGNGSIIFHNRGFANQNDMTNPKFKMIQPLNKLTITITSNMADRNYGIDAGDYFIMTLLIQDYDLEEVQPESMPILEKYHKYPQMPIKY